MEILDTGFVTVSIGLSSGGVGTIVMPPLAAGLGVAAGVSGFLSIVSKFIAKKIKTKIKTHSKILILAESKLNSICEMISRSLEDGKISNEEFKMIVNESTNYSNMKREIKMKIKPSSDEDLSSLLKKTTL